jgi:formylglycine-generating enzyme required for sulfatase activity
MDAAARARAEARRSAKSRAHRFGAWLEAALALSWGLHANAAGAAVAIDWVTITAGIIPDDTGYGAVAYDYRIGSHEVTNAQYALLLNAVAAADTYDLYNTEMETNATFGGITRSGSSGSYTYTVKPGFEDKPVVFVSFWDSLRFTNWLHNGLRPGAQDATTTEDGAYTITPAGIAANSITRNPGARVFVTSRNEWYRAAYYDAVSSTYFDYPTGTDVQTSCTLPAGDTGNSANCGPVVGALTDAESYPLSASPSGTFDQGGNVWEWNEETQDGSDRSLRGGSWSIDQGALAAWIQTSLLPENESVIVGFRIAGELPTPFPIDWVSIAAGVDADTTGFGAVFSDYQISRYEVTNTQYAIFLNAVAATDTNGLYNTEMGTNANFGGITRNGGSGSYTYSVEPGFENKPVVYISFWDSLRFANWLHNGQWWGGQHELTTEDGAYTITPAGVAANSIARNPEADAFLPNRNQWYRAAYYDAVSASYFDYPTGTDVQTSCTPPAGDTGNSANCGPVLGVLSDSGSYALSGSPSGTFDQGGNVWEWNEETQDGADRSLRGGSWSIDQAAMATWIQTSLLPEEESVIVGFRIARPNPVPEPSAVLGLISGTAALLIMARKRIRR